MCAPKTSSNITPLTTLVVAEPDLETKLEAFGLSSFDVSIDGNLPNGIVMLEYVVNLVLNPLASGISTASAYLYTTSARLDPLRKTKRRDRIERTG